MTQSELERLLDELLSLPAETEWVEFKEAKNNYDFRKLGKYFSALSNEANLNCRPAGWLVFGANKSHEVIGTNYRIDRASLDGLKKEVADKTAGRISFIEIHELNHPNGRVLLFEIPPAPAGQPTSWEGHFYGREGESLAPLTLSELDRIRNQSRPDWSAEVVHGATLDDLSPDAIAAARNHFKEKHKRDDWVGEVDRWNDAVFLNKAKITVNNRITRTAILLLGREDSAHWLAPAQTQMTWILKDEHGAERDYQHFGPPFLLTTDALFQRVRNLTYRYLRDSSLFPVEESQYDPWVIRELLHNCIAHQDYTLNGRINVVEQEDSLLFTNPGSFLPPSVEWVIEHDSPLDRYRNPFLARAMVELNMIDTIGSGIRRVFSTQRKRYFPLPDYDFSESQRVKVRLYGKVLDENYTRALITNTDLELHEVMALDRVQKRLPLNEEQFKLLKRKHLVEGRRPNLVVSAKVAKAIGGKARYIHNRGLDKAHYKELVLEYLRKYQKATPTDLAELLMDKLPDVLNHDQKKHKIRNLLQEMSSKDKTIRNSGGRGAGAIWELVS